MIKRIYCIVLIFCVFAAPVIAQENGCFVLNGDNAAGSAATVQNSGKDCLLLSDSTKDLANMPAHSAARNDDIAAMNLAVDADDTKQALRNVGEKSPLNAGHFEHISHNHDFIYQIDRPQNASGDVVILLHGSGGNEKSLMPFARSIWPRATLVGIRGRIVQKGQRRWYKKITATKFDQNNVNHEAAAFISFLTKLAEENDLDVSHATFIGYSNGANLLAVVLLQQPDLVHRAVLMRSMPVLDKMPHANLNKTSILTLSGQKDKLYSPFAPALSSLLKNNGAKVESHMVAADHMIGDLDKQFIASWSGAANKDNLSAMAAPVARSRSLEADSKR